jgi:hypothetical protein
MDEGTEMFILFGVRQEFEAAQIVWLCWHLARFASDHPSLGLRGG